MGGLHGDDNNRKSPGDGEFFAVGDGPVVTDMADGDLIVSGGSGDREQPERIFHANRHCGHQEAAFQALEAAAKLRKSSVIGGQSSVKNERGNQ